MNHATLKGHLGGDPEVRFTPSGKPVCNVSLACSEKWKDKDGTQKERTDWIRLVIWGPRGEAFAKYHKKGSEALVSGKIRTDSYEKDGVKIHTTEVEVAEWFFVGGKAAASDDSSGGDQGFTPAGRPSKTDENTSGGGLGNGGATEEDDLPFAPSYH